ncbi:MAG: hypothetical protein J6X44_14520 [Thermoguttaceae bacterium]|nr:hypothetical protein [Thermoguttaceae bacterium]
MDPAFYYTDDGDELDRAVEEGRRRRFIKRFVLFVVVLALLCVGFFFTIQRYLTPIDPENASTDKKLGWLALRDLSKESPETREKLFDMYVGSVSIPSPENAEETIYELPEPVKKASGVFLSGRDKKVEAWIENERRPPYLRVDYVVVGSDDRAGQYVESRDVEPGPALLERWETRRKGIKAGKARQKTTTIERNIQLLIMQWFNSRMKAYDAAPAEKKRAKLDAIAVDLQNFQKFYNSLRASAKMEELTLSGMLREFELTVDSWLELTTPDELARVLWFKDLMESVVLQQKISAADKGPKLFDYPPVVPGKTDDEHRKDKRSEKNAQTIERVKNALDAVKNYAFGKSE